MSDPSRWPVHEDAVRNLERVHELRRALRAFAVLVALMLVCILIGLLWV